MKVSIIIPVYNQAAFLTEAIQSALDQTVKCEIIVINDGSTDKSLEVAQRFPVKVVDQINKGLSSARNTGIMNATGDIILPLDADDILLDTCVEKILHVFENTNADIVAPSFKQFGTSNAVITLALEPTLEDFKTANRIGYFSAVKRDVLLEVGGYSPRMTYGYEDYALWIDLLKRGKVLKTISEPLILYRTKENSMIHHAMMHHNELLQQMVNDNPSVFQV